METWVPTIQKTLQEGNVHTIKATEGMLLLPGSEEGHDHDHEHGEEGHTHELDPHVWLAPSLAIKQVANIRDQLIEAYPEKQEVWTKNAAAYTEKLQALHQLYQETFVTQHAAFNYLALEYALNQVSIAGLSSSEEPSAARIAELKHFVKEHGINYIYFEENAKDSIARTLANEAGVSLEVLNPLEGLTNEQIENGEDTLTPKKEKSVYNGYFEDEDVQDRSLSDWAGTWQTVDTYVEDGTFDPVFEYKEKLNQDKTAQEYKEYYTKGYQTDIASIKISEKEMAFTFKDGTTKRSNYRYVGKEILTYEAGNRGVRYLFEAEDKESGAFRYIQFSDHTIAPADSEHFHLYAGNESQEVLLKEMENWPTFYPDTMDGREIAQEMLLH